MADRKTGVSPELDELSGNLIGEALDMLADGEEFVAIYVPVSADPGAPAAPEDITVSFVKCEPLSRLFHLFSEGIVDEDPALIQHYAHSAAEALPRDGRRDSSLFQDPPDRFLIRGVDIDRYTLTVREVDRFRDLADKILSIRRRIPELRKLCLRCLKDPVLDHSLAFGHFPADLRPALRFDPVEFTADFDRLLIDPGPEGLIFLFFVLLERSLKLRPGCTLRLRAVLPGILNADRSEIIQLLFYCHNFNPIASLT